MSKLLEDIKAQQKALRLLARGSESHKAQAEALTVVLGEVERLDKANVNDSSVLSIIKKVIAGINDMLSLTDDEQSIFKLSHQQAVLESFIPQQLTEQDIRLQIVWLGLPQELKVGDVQKHFKNKYPTGSYNAKLVNEILKLMQTTG